MEDATAELNKIQKQLTEKDEFKQYLFEAEEDDFIVKNYVADRVPHIYFSKIGYT